MSRVRTLYRERTMSVHTRPPDDNGDWKPLLVGMIEQDGDDVPIYTITPRDAEDHKRMSCWLSVPVDLVCSREEMR